MEDEKTPSGMLDFSNSPGMAQAAADKKAQEEREGNIHEEYQREMDNIKEHGPLDRATERVLSEEEQEISDLAEQEDYHAIKQAVRSKMESIGAGEEDFQVFDYYERFLGDPNPEVRDIISKMSLLTTRLVKLRGKNR
jgi:hypothetical protein